jgi:hypothetical protein
LEKLQCLFDDLVVDEVAKMDWELTSTVVVLPEFGPSQQAPKIAAERFPHAV